MEKILYIKCKSPGCNAPDKVFPYTVHLNDWEEVESLKEVMPPAIDAHIPEYSIRIRTKGGVNTEGHRYCPETFMVKCPYCGLKYKILIWNFLLEKDEVRCDIVQLPSLRDRRVER